MSLSLIQKSKQNQQYNYTRQASVQDMHSLSLPCWQYCWRASLVPRRVLPQRWHMYSEYTCDKPNTKINNQNQNTQQRRLKAGRHNRNASEYQWRWRREWRPSLSVISAAFIAFGRSCLLANTRSTASLNSSYTLTKQITKISLWCSNATVTPSSLKKSIKKGYCKNIINKIHKTIYQSFLDLTE